MPYIHAFWDDKSEYAMNGMITIVPNPEATRITFNANQTSTSQVSTFNVAAKNIQYNNKTYLVGGVVGSRFDGADTNKLRELRIIQTKFATVSGQRVCQVTVEYTGTSAITAEDNIQIKLDYLIFDSNIGVQ